MSSRLAAGIVAASAEKAQHQCTDSKAYIDKMQKLIDRANLTNKRQWSIQANGDLWQWMEDILKPKGRSSFKITKVKGHVIEQQVLEGKYTREHKEGNDASDIAADKGAEKTDITAAALGFVYARRHKFYKILMARVQAFIIKVRKVESEKREKRGNRKNHSGKQGKQGRLPYPKS